MNRLPTGVRLTPTTFNVEVPSLNQVIGTGVVTPEGKVVVTLVNGEVSPPMENGPLLREWCFEHFVSRVIGGGA